MRSLGFVAMVLFACGGDSKTKDAPTGGDAPHDSRAIDSPHADAPPLDGPPGTFLLTVKNFDAWCTVSVNGGSASAGALQQVFVLPGQIPLSATANTGFKLDAHMWHHTDGDTGNTGEAGSASGSASLATATVGSAPKCVWVCCPFTSGTGCNPALIGEQCP